MSQTVFITGATGYIGSAVAKRLVNAGYNVLGQTRNPERAERLKALGVRPVIGDLDNAAGLADAMAPCFAVVHAAADHNAAEQGDAHALDAVEKAIEAGQIKRFVYTSGIWVHGDSGARTLDETTPLNPTDLVRFRAKHEQRAFGLAGVDTVVVRPAIVYGEGRGIIGQWFEQALTKRTVTYYGDGSQSWPLVHRDDVADGYLLALRKGRAGQAYLLADGSTFRCKEIAEAVANACGAVAKSWPAAQVRETLGGYGTALMLSQRVSAAKAERELGWRPNRTDFIKDAGLLLREFHDSTED